MGSRGGGGSNGGGSQGIPSASRRMVQSLKEIVNGVPEAEIYSTLKDCNMDPNEAVNRLLSQDPFHEVKSKREKKKEFKDSTESRPRGGGGGSTSNRGARSGTDRYAGRSGSNHFSSSESDGLHGKPTYKREIETPASKVGPLNTSWNPPSFSDSHIHNASDNASVSVSQPPSATYQSTWSTAPGQKSMADIVKMGRPQPQNKSYTYSNPPPPQTTTHNHPPPPPPTNASSPDNEWPSIEPPQPVNLHSITESAINSGESNSQFESNKTQFLGYETNEVEVQDESSSEEDENDNESHSHEGNLDVSLEEEEDDDEPISSLSANIHEENHMDPVPVPPQEDDDNDIPSVVIPDHLQLHTVDCSHLSFGSFGANMNQGYSGHFTSTADAEPEPVTSSVQHSETTNLEYYEDGSTRRLDRTGANAESYDLASASQTALKQEDHHHHEEVTRGNQYGFPPTTHTHAFDFPQSQTPSQVSSPFLNAMSANGHPHPVRESDLSSYSQFSVSQSMPTRYAANSADPTISMAEALKNVGLTSTSTSTSTSSSQPAQPQQTPGSAVPPHLTMHPYSQHSLPLGGPFTNMNMNMNMMSYPFLPQSYTYMPSGFQPSTYHQQLAAAILPHYKNNLNLSTQSPTLPSGYASSGNYEDALNAHYKELQQQQQNEWARGGGSRSAVPASAYYSLQNQQQPQPQLPGGFRQPSQGYGGHPDFFHSQAAGLSQEHQLQLQLQLQQQQQQNPRDGGGSHSQGQQKLQSQQQQQLWQNGY